MTKVYSRMALMGAVSEMDVPSVDRSGPTSPNTLCSHVELPPDQVELRVTVKTLILGNARLAAGMDTAMAVGHFSAPLSMWRLITDRGGA